MAGRCVKIVFPTRNVEIAVLTNTHSVSRLRHKPLQARASWVIGSASSTYDSRPLRLQARRLPTSIPFHSMRHLAALGSPVTLHLRQQTSHTSIPTLNPDTNDCVLWCRARLHGGMSGNLRWLFRLIKAMPLLSIPPIGACRQPPRSSHP